MALSNSVSSSSTFFKPADHAGSVAMIFEARAFEPDRPSQYGPRDVITARVIDFPTEASITGNTPTIIESMSIDKTMIARDLKGDLDKSRQSGVPELRVAIVTKAESSKPGQNPAWVLRPVSQAVFEKVAAWYEAREVEAKAHADAMPDFLK